ncbi:BadF/BadG/BcrA/BcrD ATPase family protein [Reinekea sp.]|uniref:BadF/BadG/BcrA/BcrD ATPase family protein n=1 Tax=Reinekea sp. TaxID=1970455 RepID=UPI002A8330D4|nr:BadF/BadG/BcrA/BcrD ATPase family protein [Reinekea sp.]
MNRPDTHLIAIDGGGTTCRARIADTQGRILGEARAGSANIFQDVELAWRSVHQAVTEAFAHAGLAAGCAQSSVLVAGLAGAEAPSAAADFLQLAAGSFADISLLSDAQIACLGAHAGEDGTIFIVGTGAIGIALTHGTWQRVGGWGFPLNDLGSGAWLGQQALRAALEQRDGIIDTGLLTDSIWAIFPTGTEELIAWSQIAHSGDYASFAPLVLKARAGGDELATKLMSEQIALLSRQIRALPDSGRGLCMMGGLADKISTNLPQDILQRQVPALGDALAGALRYAQSRLAR